MNASASGFSHTPVMRDRITELLAPAITADDSNGSRPVVIDGTVGLGGHSAHLLTSFPTVVVVGIDRDEQALELAGERLAAFGDRFVPFHSVFDDVEGALGAVEARIGAATSTLQAMIQNFGAAEGRIIEADVSHESADLARGRILQEAASAVLAQANLQPELALRLLGR